jgi:hypothetical protein
MRRAPITPEVERVKARQAVLAALVGRPLTATALGQYAPGLPGRLRRAGALDEVLAELITDGLIVPVEIPIAYTPWGPPTRPGFALVERTEPLPFSGGKP